MRSEQLCQELEQTVQGLIQQAFQLKQVSQELLNKQPEPGKWSVAQVIEHLNSYNSYYLPEIEHSLQNGRNKGIKRNPEFKPGFFGNYFTKMMQPLTNGQLAKKYKAPKDHTPALVLDAAKVLEEFIARQNRLIDFLQQAARTDMGKLKVPISISRFIKLKLGDTFRFLIAHQQRHFLQVERTLRAIGVESVAV